MWESGEQGCDESEGVKGPDGFSTGGLRSSGAVGG